jgi:hypothetical protein
MPNACACPATSPKHAGPGRLARRLQGRGSAHMRCGSQHARARCRPHQPVTPCHRPEGTGADTEYRRNAPPNTCFSPRLGVSTESSAEEPVRACRRARARATSSGARCSRATASRPARRCGHRSRARRWSPPCCGPCAVSHTCPCANKFVMPSYWPGPRIVLQVRRAASTGGRYERRGQGSGQRAGAR